MAITLSESVRVRATDHGSYESLYNPGRMGNTADIAYGGCTIATAINAAYQTVPPAYCLYSAQGNFLGPALTDRKYLLHVQTYRQTKTFATRKVEVSQKQNDGALRLCMVILADFHCKERASLLEYSRRPTQTYSSPDESLPAATIREGLVQRGEIVQGTADAHAKQFGLGAQFWDSRLCPEGVSAQNLLGLAKNVATTQDCRQIADKTSAEWFRSKHVLHSEAQHVVALSWILDAALAFMPLTHNNMFLDDAAACSTLDFSFRTLTNHLDLSQWHLRELRTAAGGSGRTFAECLVWNEDGDMVASMTQQNILRPRL